MAGESFKMEWVTVRYRKKSKKLKEDMLDFSN